MASDLLEQIPPSQQIREQISQNMRERELLKRMLALATDRERAETRKREIVGAAG